MVTSAAVRSRHLLHWIAASDYETGGRTERLSIQSRFTSDPLASIREALLETGCDTVVVEFPPLNARRRHRLDSIVQALSEDLELNLVVARPDPAANRGGIRPRSVLVPLRGGANAWLALKVGMALSSWAQARLTLMHVYDPRHHAKLREHEIETFHELTQAATAANPDVVEIESSRLADALLDVAKDYDAVVLGAHANPARVGILVGQMLGPFVNRLSKTVILTRAASAGGLAA
jgi:nucleotide-binding universal stress UspA family protein